MIDSINITSLFGFSSWRVSHTQLKGPTDALSSAAGRSSGSPLGGKQPTSDVACTTGKALRGCWCISMHTDKVSGTARYSGMASILPFIKPEDGAFDDEVTRNMGEAFNAAVQVLRSTAQPAVVYASIAARIIEAAGRGECDPMRLQQAGLTALESCT
jgi:hypothetical protein